MDIHKSGIDIERILYRGHMGIYAFLVTFFTIDIWNRTGWELGITGFYSILFIIFIVVESLDIHWRKESTNRKYVMKQILVAFQMAISYLSYFIIFDDYRIYVGGMLLLMYSLEFLYRMDFERIERRCMLYVGVSLSLVIVNLIYVETRQIPGSDELKQVVCSMIVAILIVVLSECLVKIWDYYNKKILSQYRIMDRLNDGNAELKRQQDRLNRVNELLGMQKIQLQAANLRINNAHNEMDVQSQVSTEISKTLDLKKMLESVCDRIFKSLDLDLIWITVDMSKLDNQTYRGGEPFFVHRTCQSDELEILLKETLRGGGFQSIFDVKKTYVNNQCEENQFWNHERIYLHSIISVPLIRKGIMFGNIMAGSLKNNAFIDNREFFETIAGQLTTGIVNINLYDQMRDMAIRDGLTRIYNRRYLTEQLHEILKDCEKKGKSVSVALFDIDKFKMINDTFGHLFGDEVIRHVAGILQAYAVNNSGMAGRYGGEEFVLVFPDKNVEQAYEIVRQVHEEIRSGELYHGGKAVAVRVSSGISSYPETCVNSSDVLTRADWAMYHSKRNGRDQITIDSDKMTTEM